MKRSYLLKIYFFVFSLSSCVFGSGSRSGVGGLSSQVLVRVHSQFNDDTFRSISGRPYIRTESANLICRQRNFRAIDVRDSLLDAGVPRDILDDNFFGRGGFGGELLEDEEEGGEARSENTDDNERRDIPERLEVAGNWIQFGLQIQNNTDFVLVVTSVSLAGIGRCAGKQYDYGPVERTVGYCSENSNFPILYLVPPRQKVDYRPQDINAFHNLTLIFEGFEIDDRRNELSKEIQDAANNIKTNNTQQQIGSGANIEPEEQRCQPDRRPYGIPEYDLELRLRGYFAGLDINHSQVSFFQTVRFFTDPSATQ